MALCHTCRSKAHCLSSFRIKALILVPGFFAANLAALFQAVARRQEIPELWRRSRYYQAGGDFLVDRKGNILFAHRSQDPADRPPIEKLLEAIDRTNISAGKGR